MRKFLALLLCMATPVFGQMRAPSAGVADADFVTSTNLAQARNISSTNVEARLVVATNTLEAACNGFFAKDLALVAFTNLAVTAVMTNGWDVSAGGGGGGNADDTNYWGQLAYGSNDWQSLTTGVTNDCIFSLEVADFGNLCNPLTGHITTRKTGWWEVNAAWWMVHPISSGKIGVFIVMTNDNDWISQPVGAYATIAMETDVWRVQDRAYLPSGTVVRCAFFHNSSSDRVGGGDTDHASSYAHNVSVFTMDFIQE